MDKMTICRYDTLTPDQIDKIFALYNNSFELVKIKKSKFINRLFDNDHKKIYFIAELCKDIIGYSIIIRNSIFLLIVNETYRNKGIGIKLLEISEQEIKKEGYDEIGLISPNYLFCGVPMDIKSSYYKWFEHRGFVYDWTSFDMIVDLENLPYTTNETKYSLDNVIFKKLSTDEIESCSKGADIVQEGWGQYFLVENVNALVAKIHNQVIGGIVVHQSECIFNESLKNCGHFGALWVLNEYRNKGIGMQLCQRALIELKETGFKMCHIGYTYLDKWYGKLGAKKYINYWIGNKRL